jgi:hypothetical protein
MVNAIRPELFHRIAEQESAAARRRTVELGLADVVAFRNVDFESHGAALAERGGERTPALWDGTRLHVGLDAVVAALQGLASIRSAGAGLRGRGPR